MTPKTAHFRFYEELNDFLPTQRRKTSFSYKFSGEPSLREAIKSLNVPHAEIDLILVNGISVDFDHPLADQDRVSVYPVFESLDITPVIHLREKPLRQTKFLLDVHLGELARRLDSFGFDVHYYKDTWKNEEILALAQQEKRIILTRDRNILKAKSVTHGYWIRSENLDDQIKEVLERFDLSTNLGYQKS